MHIDEHLDQSANCSMPSSSAPARMACKATRHRRPLLRVERGRSGRGGADHRGLAGAGIAVITLPAANLFLQGRDATSLPPRGLTRVRQLVAAGVPVAAASDNIQDLHSDRSGDLLEVALTLPRPSRARRSSDRIRHGGLRPRLDHHRASARAGASIKARADLLITDADDPEDLVATGSSKRAVLVGGVSSPARCSTVVC